MHDWLGIFSHIHHIKIGTTLVLYSEQLTTVEYFQQQADRPKVTEENGILSCIHRQSNDSQLLACFFLRLSSGNRWSAKKERKIFFFCFSNFLFMCAFIHQNRFFVHRYVVVVAFYLIDWPAKLTVLPPHDTCNSGLRCIHLSWLVAGCMMWKLGLL